MKKLNICLVILVILAIVVVPAQAADKELRPDNCQRLGMQPDCVVSGPNKSSKLIESSWAPPAERACARVWTSERFINSYDSSYDVVTQLRAWGWGQFKELEKETTGEQDADVRHVLASYAPFTNGDLLMIDYSTGAWWEELSPSTQISLTRAVSEGLQLVIVNEFYGFAGDKVANFVDGLPISVVYDRSRNVVVESNPAYWLGSWNNAEWFYGIFPESGLIAGAHTATGNYYGGAEARALVWSPTGQFASLVHEPYGSGNIRLFADSTGVGDLAVNYYGDGLDGDWQMQSLIWGCHVTGGMPIPEPTAVEFIAFSAKPATTWWRWLLNLFVP